MARSKATFVMPTPYVVKLVAPGEEPTTSKPPVPKPPPPKVEKAAPPQVEKGVSAVAPDSKDKPKKAPKKTFDKEKFSDYKSERLSDIKAKAEQQQYKSDRLSAIKAKQNLRRIAEIKKGITVRAGPSVPPASSQEDASILNEYFLQVQDRIWENWIFPNAGARNLEAVVSITVMKDGRAKVNGFERSSGNAFFDQSALKAIEKASPFDPPPFEMEIGVRFRPDEQ
jgi:TonB family protein